MSIVKNWEESAILLDNTGVLSRREIAKSLGVPKSTLSDYLRTYDNFKNVPVVQEVAKEDNSRILVISDLHAPYHDPNAVGFLSMLKDRYDFTRIISVGDEQDISAASFHDANVDMLSAGHELAAAQKVLQELESIFPKMDIMSSNHGDLYYRRAKHHGIPLHVIKSYNDVLGVGNGWQWHTDLIVQLPTDEDVYFCHGKSQNGLKLSQNMSMNCVQGHFHNSFNIQYWSSPRALYWSMQVGCLIDDKSLAMAYNKLTVNRPIIGCGVIIDGIPSLEVMPK
jgi:hypothetical protein